MNAFTMGTRLRDMIRAIRACKTAAEERAVVRKECAAIRTSISENDPDYRHRNLAKLMFIHMLGYPTHFGQMECLKLIASAGFPEKRIGYLGLMLLLDERQEVLMLVTNSLKQDLNHVNQYIVGLALCALGNICSAEMARDLAPEVEKLLQNSNANIRKKAALCSVRIIRKVPDLAENFMKPASALLSEKHHGVLIAGIQLCTELCKASTEALDFIRKYTKDLVRILKNMITSGYAPEYDVGGITDPFLQIRVLRLLRILGKGDADSSDIMSDILAQVATNTESNKNAGNAILYECVQTIMAIEAIGGLRVLAINILGRFLSNRDNNIRYVALNMLMKAIAVDFQAVQRHRATILECVKDSDASIRKRALELVFVLVNDTNVKSLTKELLEYLEVSDPEFKGDLTAKICAIVEKFAPSKLWYIDQMIRVLVEAGSYVTDDVCHTLIVAISNAMDLQGYTVRSLYRASQHRNEYDSLVRVTIWCIGEYGEMLVNHAGELDGEEPLTVVETRFATHYIVLKRLVDVKQALKSMVISDIWAVWRQSQIDRANNVRRLILDEDCWAQIDYLLSFTEPIYTLIHRCDTDKPILGDIYDCIDTMVEQVRDIIIEKEQDPSEFFYKQIYDVIKKRWDKMTTPLQLLAYALNPKYYHADMLALPNRTAPNKDVEVVEGYKKDFKKMFTAPRVAAEIRDEFGTFASSDGTYADVDAMADKKKMHPIKWWNFHGAMTTHLQKLAIKLLSQVTESDVVDVIEALLKRSTTNMTTQAMALTSLLKLSSRFPPCSERIKGLIIQHKGNFSLELQQRSIEFSSILHKHENIKSALVERMPVLDESTYAGKKADTAGAVLTTDSSTKVLSPGTPTNLANGVSKPPMNALMDLLDLSVEDTPSPTVSSGDILQDLLGIGSPATPLPGLGNTSAGNANVLLDLLSIGTPPAPVQSTSTSFTQVQESPVTAVDPLSQLASLASSVSPSQEQRVTSSVSDNRSTGLAVNGIHEATKPSLPVSSTVDLLGDLSPLAAPAVSGDCVPTYPSIVAFQSKSLKVTFDFTKQQGKPQLTLVQASFTNLTTNTFTDFIFQAAVPKFMQLHLDPASSNILPPVGNGRIVQGLSVSNSQHGQKSLAMRVRIAYKVSGQDVVEQGQVNNFPAGL